MSFDTKRLRNFALSILESSFPEGAQRAEMVTTPVSHLDLAVKMLAFCELMDLRIAVEELDTSLQTVTGILDERMQNRGGHR